MFAINNGTHVQLVIVIHRVFIGVVTVFGPYAGHFYLADQEWTVVPG